MRASLSYAVFRAAVGLAGILAMVVACTPSVGDRCNISTDCSTQGDKLCDTSQPGGYCTQLNCLGNKCVDDALCISGDGGLIFQRLEGYPSHTPARRVASCLWNFFPLLPPLSAYP